ncbi:ribonuclease III [Parvibium lacunae]|uniref:Ribonuclease 3 n=1 Tax=Parvibium lacunae TaxID=1888893 RepID=A0A368L778_9BURK|nr:ribonuclease III [Parvibium lacunae]
MTALAVLEQRIGYSFRQPALLRQAMTHRSHSLPHNERLEFLGDSVLNCAVAQILYEKFATETEGDLSRIRANLVQQQTLHQLSQTLQLEMFLCLGEGELRSGGLQRPSILADAFEALLGAMLLDGGFAAAEKLVRELYAPLLSEIALTQITAKDPKTQLQELLQGQKKPLPTYAVTEISGAAHAQAFHVLCDIPSLGIRVPGVGQSRRAAEQAAAQAALAQLPSPLAPAARALAQPKSAHQKKASIPVRKARQSP